MLEKGKFVAIKTNVAELVLNHIKLAVEALNVELVEVDYVKKNDGMHLNVFIDSPSGIDLAKCEAVHLTIDPMLDELDPTGDTPYTLSVSSLGLDWPLKTERDFLRNMGQQIEVKLFAAIGGKKVIVGKLLGQTEKEITIEVTGVTAPAASHAKELSIEKSKIAKCTKHIQF